MLVDSHCHLDMLDLAKYQGDLSAALAAAYAMDVQYFLCAGIDLAQTDVLLRLAHTHANVVISIGMHPTEGDGIEVSCEDICMRADDSLVVAVGETGLDYYHVTDENMRELQRQKFATHIRAAKMLQKPLIIHARDAMLDVMRIMCEERAHEVGGVMHCFSGDSATAQSYLDMGFYISFSGVITFKNAATLREVAQQVPLDKMLLETDAPFLAPVPYRGKSNEPGYLRYVAECVAQLRGISYQELAEITTANFFKLFGVKKKNMSANI